MNVLVTGGAGYIGSHAIRGLLAAGHRVVAVDNLSRGHAQAVDPAAELVVMDLRETDKLAALLRESQIDCVMHFAALALVSESVTKPLWYYRTNIEGTLSLLEGMLQARVKQLVFSSTCAVYGIPDQIPVSEDCPRQPISPYGWSKLACEQMIADCQAIDPEFSFVALRYFNVAGAAADGTLGEDHDPETHLIPLILKTALGQRESLTIFGTDYPTPDGTCVRDYIHVEDLCQAHVLALHQLRPGQGEVFNLGIGRGYSVREIVKAAERVTRRHLSIRVDQRRPGDPPALYASAERARRELNWSPQHTEIEAMIATAWDWFSAHPHGYPP